MPISKSNRQQEPLSALLLCNAEYALGVCFKLVLLPVGEAYSRQLLADHPDAHLSANNLVYWQILACFCASSLAGTWMMDVQLIAINVVTLGRFEMLPMNNYTLLSGSVKEFWAGRYNLLIHTLLKETVFVPLRHYFPTMHPQTAGMGAFAVSGILHSWVAYFTFGRGVVRSCVFFVLQNIWIAFELSSPYKNLPRFVGGLLSLMFLVGTMPIYAGLFVEGYPLWLSKNDPAAPTNIPLLSNVSEWCLTHLLQVKPDYWS